MKSINILVSSSSIMNIQRYYLMKKSSELLSSNEYVDKSVGNSSIRSFNFTFNSMDIGVVSVNGSPINNSFYEDMHNIDVVLYILSASLPENNKDELIENIRQQIYELSRVHNYYKGDLHKSNTHWIYVLSNNRPGYNDSIKTKYNGNAFLSMLPSPHNIIPNADILLDNDVILIWNVVKNRILDFI